MKREPLSTNGKKRSKTNWSAIILTSVMIIMLLLPMIARIFR